MPINSIGIAKHEKGVLNMHVFYQITELVGHTPLLKLSRYCMEKPRALKSTESWNT